MITINVTAQKWLDKSEVDKVVWSHTLKIAVPKFRGRRKSISESCLLMITTDQNDGFISDKTFTNVALTQTAVGAKSVVAILSGALFQPLTFKDDPLRCKNITGYDIVACSWRRFMKNGTAPAPVLVQFPIVKAVVESNGHHNGLRAKKRVWSKCHKVYNSRPRPQAVVGSLGLTQQQLTRGLEAIAPVAMDFLNFTKELASHLDPMGKEASLQRHTEFLGEEKSSDGKIMPNTDYLTLRKNKLMERIASFYFTVVEKIYAPSKISWEMNMVIEIHIQ
uniref:Uncharacterized protein n=1 Tax=Sphaerodactylus townsendi TaxID=933632 RepID=A0ACB8FG35_9SAUR